MNILLWALGQMVWRAAAETPDCSLPQVIRISQEIGLYCTDEWFEGYYMCTDPDLPSPPCRKPCHQHQLLCRSQPPGSVLQDGRGVRQVYWIWQKVSVVMFFNIKRFRNLSASLTIFCFQVVLSCGWRQLRERQDACQAALSIPSHSGLVHWQTQPRQAHWGYRETWGQQDGK